MSSEWSGQKPMSKSELSSYIAGRTGMTKKAANEVLDALADVACSETSTKGQFTVPGLGKFVTSMRKARMGRNPSTGQTIHIPEKKVVKFKVAKNAKERMT
ncbi:MAG: HU family DNA-binding protein [Thermodesulfobacteriota bacterium]